MWRSISLLAAAAAGLGAAEYTLSSPEELVQVVVRREEGRLSYAVNYGRRPMVLDSEFALEGWAPGRYVGSEQRQSFSVWRPLYGERASIPDNFNELTLRFERLTVFVRAYEEGVAFRYRLEGQGKFELAGERSEFRFPRGAMAWEEQGTEGEYFRVPAARIKDNCERPLTVDPGNGLWLSVAEAGQTDYPRMLLGAREGAVVTQLDGNVKGALPFETPWRVIVLGRRPGDLLERNYLILNLSRPQVLTDVTWIKPGKVIREVTLSTRGGRAAVDFAAANGLQYVEYDAGWYGHEYDDEADARTVSPDPKRIANIPDHGGLDLEEVIGYARQKGIGVILYVNRRELERRMDELFPLYRKWGVAGVKFGFVQVKGQEWAAWLTEAVKKAAAYRLMVDVHDSYRPSGLTRTYPNLMTVEGVRGNEHMPTAAHNATLPFTRAVAGSLDYTICWMTERLKTTWGHQLAQLVVHYSPWNFVFWYDRPEQITPSPGLEFFALVPTTWDETRVLAGAIGSHAVVARRKGREWFIGAITNEEPRTVEIRLGMLAPPGWYELKTWCDGDGARDVRVETQEVRDGQPVQLRLAPSGGCAARLRPL